MARGQVVADFVNKPYRVLWASTTLQGSIVRGCRGESCGALMILNPQLLHRDSSRNKMLGATVAPLPAAGAWWAVRCGISWRPNQSTRGDARGFRVFRQGEGAAGEARPVYGRPHLSERAPLRGGGHAGNALAAAQNRRGDEAQGQGGRSVESVPAGIRARRRPHQSRIRAALRN